MLAEENVLQSDSDSSPDSGDLWRNGCPESPEWISSGPTSAASFGFEYYEHNVENLAIEVVGQKWSSEVISLFLKDWEVGRVALSCHLSMDLLCQEMRDACKGEGAQSRWVPLVHCVQSAWKKEGCVLMPRFRLSMRGLACRLVTVLNMLCLPSE